MTPPRRTGVVTRAQLRRREPQPPRHDLMLVGGGGLVVLAVLMAGSMMAAPRPDPGPSARPTDVAALPSATVAASSTGRPTISVFVTFPPSPSPTTAPTPSPTRSPTPPPPTMPPTPTPPPAPTAPASGLVIRVPSDRSVVEQRQIVVRGLAPPGAVITREIPFWFDDHAVADGQGNWFMPVDLGEGENRLVFRVGDFFSTRNTLTVFYRRP